MEFRTVVDWSSTFGETITEQRIVEMVEALPRESGLSAVAQLGLLLFNRRSASVGQQHQDQMDLAVEVCGPILGPRIRQQLNRSKLSSFVHDEQLALAAKLLMVRGADGDQPIDVPSLARFLLAVNEALSDDDALFEQTGNLGLAVSLRRLGGFPHQQARYLIARYYDMFVKRAATAEYLILGQSLNEAFALQTGVSFEQFIGFALAFFAPYGGAKSVADLIDSGYPQSLQDLLLSVPEHVRDRLLGDLAATREEYLNTWQLDDIMQLARYLPFRQRPYYKSSDGTVEPLIPEFCLDKVSIALHHELVSFASMNGGTDAVATANGFVGKMFEGYVTELLAEAHAVVPYACDVLDEDKIIELSPNRPAAEQPPFDVALVIGDALLLLEVSTASLRLTTVESGDPAAFAEDIQTYFRPKFIDQLKRGLKSVDEGEWLSDLDLSSIRWVYPILVLLHPFPQTTWTWQALLNECGLVQPNWEAFSNRLAAAQPIDLQMLHSEDLEMLEPLLPTTSLVEFLRAKLDSAETKYASIKDSILQRGPEVKNERVLAIFKEARDVAKASLGIQLD
jgi:hypothetical protein